MPPKPYHLRCAEHGVLMPCGCLPGVLGRPDPVAYLLRDQLCRPITPASLPRPPLQHDRAQATLKSSRPTCRHAAKNRGNSTLTRICEPNVAHALDAPAGPEPTGCQGIGDPRDHDRGPAVRLLAAGGAGQQMCIDQASESSAISVI